MAQALYYMCSFSLGNFTYLYRCRIVDQFCCGHTCCFKDNANEEVNLFESWYFWSLILVVFVVFGCIVVSYVLSTLKQKHDIQSWTLMAGSAFNNLATTVIGKHGIIQPRLHYQPSKPRRRSNNDDGRRRGSSPSAAANPRRDRGDSRQLGMSQTSTSSTLLRLHRPSVPTLSYDVELEEIDFHPDLNSTAGSLAMSGRANSIGGDAPRRNKRRRRRSRTRNIRSESFDHQVILLDQSYGKKSISGPVSTAPRQDDEFGATEKSPKWVQAQLNPLQPAYKSSWSGNDVETRLAASTQVFFPPGFINT